MIDLHFENNITNHWAGVVIPGWSKINHQQMIIILKTAFHFSSDGVLTPACPAPGIIYHGKYHDIVPFKQHPEIMLSGLATTVNNSPISISLTYNSRERWQKNTSPKKLSLQQQSLDSKKPKNPPDSFNFAPNDQYLPAPLTGGEILSMTGITTQAIHLTLPTLRPQITLHTPEFKELLPDAICDTLLLEMRAQSLTFTFRAAISRTHTDTSPGLLAVSMPQATTSTHHSPRRDHA